MQLAIDVAVTIIVLTGSVYVAVSMFLLLRLLIQEIYHDF